MEASASAYGGGVFIADKSAWERADHDALSEEWAMAVGNHQIAVCQITAIELLYSARTRYEFEQLEDELAILRLVPITPLVWNAARGAFRELASRSDGYHRVQLPDLLIAACAHEAGLGVLHYDHHYDKLAEVLGFDSRWIAEPGSIP